MATDAIGAHGVRALQILTDLGAILGGERFAYVTGEHGASEPPTNACFNARATEGA